jgi:hypothetical protein
MGPSVATVGLRRSFTILVKNRHHTLAEEPLFVVRKPVARAAASAAFLCLGRVYRLRTLNLARRSLVARIRINPDGGPT